MKGRRIAIVVVTALALGVRAGSSGPSELSIATSVAATAREVQKRDSTTAVSRRDDSHAGRGEQAQVDMIVDGNGNGIDDIEDVRTGVDCDTNHNGTVDSNECFVDMAWSTKHRRLGPDAFAEPDRHFRVRYEQGDSITVIYAVAKPEVRVHIVVLKGPGQVLSLWDGLRAPGAYQIKYVPKETDGRPKYRGLEVVRATIDGKVYMQPLAWLWK